MTHNLPVCCTALCDDCRRFAEVLGVPLLRSEVPQVLEAMRPDPVYIAAQVVCETWAARPYAKLEHSRAVLRLRNALYLATGGNITPKSVDRASFGLPPLDE